MAYFSNKLNAGELQELGMLDSKIKDALDASDKFMDDISERLAYVNREMALMDYKSDTEGHYRDGFADGKAEEHFEMLKTMILNGADDETINKLTNVSLEEIKEIRQKIK
ncbi:hypothetical protein SAMN02745213_00348 [Succinivibrio dextrinosolvens DSM 3072]|jgi:hypothetical protein|uniref:Uncharacterized protein n=2 Tax=Succinivibrio dextrinosolvens TaxID=83771 RepID=A0A1T4UZP1_9GAMM|nr:hypothetical protein [Succinivibrio dextrinosolvens]SKA58115.1 hypothetical protein SAMN02745213_00348 [Succinivibrio dextrinosolvens DSM 3072]